MNLRTLIVCLIAAMLFSCKEGQKLQSKDGYAAVPVVSKGEAVATFAGGCRNV
jgi:peptide-methionine (S)-S-oxide reductase